MSERMIKNPAPFWGRMLNPTSSAKIVGPCGDDMEFFVSIKDNVIIDVSYYTEKGCSHTKVAGAAVCSKVKCKDVFDALEVNAGTIIKEEGKLLGTGKHCAILAVTTFYRAVALYLLKNEASNSEKID